MKKIYLYNEWHLEPHPFHFQSVSGEAIFLFDQDLRRCQWASRQFIFLFEIIDNSSAGCILSGLAVFFAPDLDAPQNLGFGNISAPRKRLNCFQVVR